MVCQEISEMNFGSLCSLIYFFLSLERAVRQRIHELIKHGPRYCLIVIRFCTNFFDDLLGALICQTSQGPLIWWVLTVCESWEVEVDSLGERLANPILADQFFHGHRTVIRRMHNLSAQGLHDKADLVFVGVLAEHVNCSLHSALHGWNQHVPKIVTVYFGRVCQSLHHADRMQIVVD